MPAITYDRFDAGLDLRKGASVSDANRLRVLTNAYVTTGRSIRKRPGLSLFAILEAGTKGLVSGGGKLNTFYGAGSISHANTLFKANLVAHPTSFALTKIRYGDMFNGYMYVAAEYVDSSIYHHYLDGGSPTRITDVNCPHGKGVIKKASKIFSTKGDVVRFCATNNARDWTTAANAGFLPVGLQQSGATDSKALGEYNKQLVVFFTDSAQVWTVDPDPAKHAFDQAVNIGTRYQSGHANMAGDVFFPAPSGFRSMTLATLTGNLQDVDVGSPIDSLVKPDLTTSADPIAFYYRGGGQFWCIFGSKAYVYSFSRTAKIAAWSLYEFPFVIDAVAELDAVLYLRHDDNVYKLDDAQYTDNGAPVDVTVELPFVDFKQPGVLKQIMGMDAVITGTATIQHRYDPNDISLITTGVSRSGDTRPDEMTPVEVCATNIAPVIAHAANEAFELSALTYYYQSLGAM